MASSTNCVRHGLYLPVDLLAKIKRIALREKKSINKQLERIITEWFDFQKSKKPEELSREEFHKLPIWRRRQILADQAAEAAQYYTKSDDWRQLQGDDILEY